MAKTVENMQTVLLNKVVGIRNKVKEKFLVVNDFMTEIETKVMNMEDKFNNLRHRNLATVANTLNMKIQPPTFNKKCSWSN